MANSISKKQEQQLDFKSKYEKIIKKANEVNKYGANIIDSHYPANHFVKFSLYTDKKSSITSFNTNASL